MIREIIHLEIGPDRLPAPTPADLALGNVLSLVPIKLWASVPEALNTCFEHGTNPPNFNACGRFCNLAALKFNAECLVALGQLGAAVDAARPFDFSQAPGGLAADTRTYQQYSAKAWDAEQALRPLVDGEAYGRFVDLGIAYDLLTTYAGRIAYQVGFAEGRAAHGL